MKMPKQAYTAEFKELAVKRAKDGQSVGMVCRELGLSEQALRNWIKAAAEGWLNGAGGRVVTSEEMELFRLRAENPRLKRENEIQSPRLSVGSQGYRGLPGKLAYTTFPVAVVWGGPPSCLLALADMVLSHASPCLL